MLWMDVGVCNMEREELIELLCQALETERDEITIFETAVPLAENPSIGEAEAYLQQPRNHKQILVVVLKKTGFDPSNETPECTIVMRIGESMVLVVQISNRRDHVAAEIAAAERLAETNGHLTEN